MNLNSLEEIGYFDKQNHKIKIANNFVDFELNDQIIKIKEKTSFDKHFVVKYKNQINLENLFEYENILEKCYICDTKIKNPLNQFVLCESFNYK